MTQTEIAFLVTALLLGLGEVDLTVFSVLEDKGLQKLSRLVNAGDVPLGIDVLKDVGDELITSLKTVTNLRAVRDDESATGWNVEFDPFPGWETVPTW